MMAKYLLLMMCWSFPAMLSAQHFVIRADKMNKVYIGISNRLTVVSGSCSCDALSVTADKGTITKIADCTYNYTPAGPGNAVLSIFENKNGKALLIGKNTLRVKNIPAAVAAVGGKTGGGYPLNQFKVQTGLSVLMEDFQYDKPYYRVMSFNFKTYRNGILLAEVPVNGNIFSQDCHKAMEGLKVGDKVIIDQIKATCPSCTIRSLNPITFTLK